MNLILCELCEFIILRLIVHELIFDIWIVLQNFYILYIARPIIILYCRYKISRFFKSIFFCFHVCVFIVTIEGNVRRKVTDGKKTERKRKKMSVVHRWCRVFAVLLSISLSLIFAHCRSLGRQRWRSPSPLPSNSLVGSARERLGERGRTM